MTETGSDFTLTETGTIGSTTLESGNTVDGEYTRGITGSDSYSMVETGTNIGGTFSEVVTGSDNYTLNESGNPATDTFDRTIIGSGTYIRSDTGAGATLPSGSGTIGYTLNETADVLGAVFSQSETGSDRYSLLEHFNDVSNTGSGNMPGNMNFFPFGQPFVDPDLTDITVLAGGENMLDIARRLTGNQDNWYLVLRYNQQYRPPNGGDISAVIIPAGTRIRVPAEWVSGRPQVQADITRPLPPQTAEPPLNQTREQARAIQNLRELNRLLQQVTTVLANANRTLYESRQELDGRNNLPIGRRLELEFRIATASTYIRTFEPLRVNLVEEIAVAVREMLPLFP